MIMKKIALIFILLLILTACKDDGGDAAVTDLEMETEPQISTEEPEPETTSGPAELEEPQDAWWMEGAEDEDKNENGNGDGEEQEETVIREPRTPRIYYSFLTGHQVTRAQQRKRPAAIMINNIRQAQPTVGVGQADIIYEAIVEGGATRLMLLVADYEDVPVLGSVRSMREYYVDLSQGHDAIFVHAGGATSAYTETFMRNVDRLDGVNRVDRRDRAAMTYFESFYRDTERRKTMAIEHTMMTSGAGIVAGVKKAKYRTHHTVDYPGPFNFNPEFKELPGNNTANYIAVPFSGHFSPEFIYNPGDKLYYRKQFGTAHLDGATGEQLRFDNIIILFAEYTPQPAPNPNGYVDCELTATGYGFYINSGKYITIRWRKDTRDGALNLFNLNNSDLYLNPGKSFVCITSTNYNRSVVINSDLKETG